MNYYLGIDNGLTSVKTVLFDENGNRVAVSEAKTPVNGDLIDADALWQITADCIRKTVAEVDAACIKSVANSGHGNGLYVIKDGRCIYAASSMSHLADDILSRVPAERIIDETLQSVWAGQPAAIMKYLKSNCPDIYADAEYFMFCKDYIKYMLTGRATTDFSDAGAGGLLNPETKKYSNVVFEDFDIQEAYTKMPQLLESVQAAGEVTAEAAYDTGLKEGTVVAAGAFDVNSCLIGSGAFNDYCVISGTWGINAGLSDVPIKSNKFRQCCTFSDVNKYICIDSSPTSAVNLEWFTNSIIGESDYREVNRMMEMAKDTNIIYLPFLYEPELGGGFFGLSYNTTAADMIKALLEGVCFEHRRQTDNLRQAGIAHKSVVLSGGAANSDFWMQLFADVFNMPVTTVMEKQAGALGVAICAAVCSGQYADLYSAAEAMVKTDKTFIPQKHYDEKYERYLKVIDKMKEI